MAKTSDKSSKASKSKTKAGAAQEAFDINALAAETLASPLKLRDWLDTNIPFVLGPQVTALSPSSGQRGSIITIEGSHFAASRLANKVSIGGVEAPVLAATNRELKVLVPADADSGTVEVTVGSHTSAAPNDFTITGYPGEDDDGPPVLSSGVGLALPGDVNPIGPIRVLVVVCQATDEIPPDLGTVVGGLDTRWADVQTYYDQASYGRTQVQYDIVPDAAQLDGTFTTFVNLAIPVQNVIGAQTGHIAAIGAKHAQDNGFALDSYQMLCLVVYTGGQFIRALGGVDTQNFSYDDGKPATDPSHIHININVPNPINLLWINENANWGRFAHEFGHNIVSAPTSSGDGSATLGEDIYGSDLVDPAAASAQNLDLMGNHDSHPIFSGYHLQKLGYYNNTNIKTLQWNGTPHTEDVTLVAHGLSEDTDPNRVHLLRINISSALSYFVEIRQRPGATTQVFDPNIPSGAAPNQGGVIVTRVISDVMHNNQQTRFIALMHEERVQLQGDVIEDPLRQLRITVTNDALQARPLACSVNVTWGQALPDNPAGTFDLSIAPWDSSYQTPDIWVDRDPIGTFDNPLDADGRPTGNGDRPWVMHINQFTARTHVSGATGADDVRLIFYAVTPPGVGDNGNWAPLAVKSIGNIAANGFKDAFCDWVPVVGKHTCLKVAIVQQAGEISGGNNIAQENVSSFQAAGSSPADPIFITTAIRNPLDEPRAIAVHLSHLPLGWTAQIPHAWVNLDGKAEKEIEVMVWPTEDLNTYRLGKRSEGRYPSTAPVRVTGHVPRSYTEVLPISKTVAGSRYFPIGGTLYNVSARRRSTIRIELSKRTEFGFVRLDGMVSPPRFGQRVLVDVLLPDGKTYRSSEVQTDGGGHFDVLVRVLDETGHVPQGTYRAQGYIFESDELADASSAPVVFNQ